MRPVISRCIALALSCTLSVFSAATELNPRAGWLALQDFQERTLNAIRETEQDGFIAYSDRLSPTFRELVAITPMSADILGDHWQTLTLAQQVEFSNLFSQMLLRNFRNAFRQAGVSSMGQLSTSAGSIFDTKGTQGRAMCTSLKLDRCVSFVTVSGTVGDANPLGGRPLKLEYRLMPSATGWVIVDVRINDIGILGAYSHIRSTLKDHGADVLLRQMRSSVERFQSDK